MKFYIWHISRIFSWNSVILWKISFTDIFLVLLYCWNFGYLATTARTLTVASRPTEERRETLSSSTVTSLPLSFINNRGYWMIYRGPRFLSRSFDLAPRPPLLPHLPVNSAGDTQEDWKRETSCWRDREGEGGWTRNRIIRPQGSQGSSISHSILSY